MLFDLQGKRRRVIQVVYACLAILMGGSLVLFGVGSDAPGGILDGLGVTDQSGSTDPQYDEEIEAAEERLATNPNDHQALLTLARYRSLSAAGGIQTDPETGTREISAEARDELERAREAWQSYLDTNPNRPDAGVATNIAQFNEFLFDDALSRGDAEAALSIAEDTVEAYEVAATDEPTAVEYGGIARFSYFAGNDKKGERALDQAVTATDPEERQGLRRALEQNAKQAQRLNRQLQRLVKTGDTGTEAIENPFGGLGGGQPDLGQLDPGQ